MTGLIYIVIIALWAAVLIPMWLRRHDQISEVRSTARFSSAMRSLGGQGQPQYATDLPYAMQADTVAVPRPASGSRSPEVRAMRPTTDSRALGLDPSYERELARQSASTRRAVILGSLTLILLATLVMAVAGLLPRWAPVAAAVPVVAFVIAAAMTASARTSSRPSASERPARRERPARAERAEASARPAREEREVAMAPAAAVDDDWETWNAWDDDESWDAVPTTLPTYVTAPRASAVPRGIDRSHPGEWTGSAMVETAQSMRTRSRADSLSRPADVDYHADTAEIPAVRDGYSARRAVNE